VDAIVFLVDAVDRERFSESKRELDGLLADETLAKVPPPSPLKASQSKIRPRCPTQTFVLLTSGLKLS